VPLTRGGSHSITNIVPACKTCNSSKRDRLLHEWPSSRTAQLADLSSFQEANASLRFGGCRGSWPMLGPDS
jgi:5-methylcytosine-specific restriction endonuclease McrA